MTLGQKVISEEIERQTIFLKTEKNKFFKIGIEEKINSLKSDLKKLKK